MIRTPFKKKCRNCKEVFEFKAFAIEVKKRIFCSKRCANIFNKDKNSKSKLGNKNPMFGKLPWNFKDKIISSDGYVLVTVNGKKVKEHRYLMEKKLKRKLLKREVVHHIDGNKQNNNLSNLILCYDEQKHRKFHQGTRDGKGKFATCINPKA